jgi:hypothetical protein
VATSRLSFSYRYTLPTPSVEVAGRVSKSATVVDTFWLALTKVGCGVPSWLMVMAMALARAQAFVKSMVEARSVPSVALHRCSSVIWASRAACSLANSS